MHIHSKIFGSSLIVLGSLSLLSACAPTLIGTGAGVVDVATQDRGAKGVANDTGIRAEIDAALIKNSPSLFKNVGLAVQDGCVLLTGSVRTLKSREDAVTLTGQVKGVKVVYDEIKVGDPHSFGDASEDVWIATKVRAELLTATGIHSNNYSVTAFNGVVYLMGIALNQEELNHALQIIKGIKGVKKVVSHMEVK